MGTLGGLNHYDPETETFTHYLHDPDDPNSLGNDRILSLLEDREGVLWIGLDSAGLNRLDRRTEDGDPPRFTRFVHNPADPQSLSDYDVTALYEDRAGILWVGTWTAGLNALDLQADDEHARFKRYQHDPEDPHSLGKGIVWDIHEDPAGVLWVGTAGGGLCQFDRESETFACYVHEQDDDHSLSSNTVWAIHPDQDGSLWLGTSAGLNRFSPQTGQFTHYNKADGLPHNTVVGILEDDSSPGDGHGDLWLSTLGGLSHFDPQLGTFRNYDARDGLQGDTFNLAVYQTSKGMMMFGGQNGLTSFYPQAVQENPNIPPVRVTGFALSNEPVFIGDDSPLQRSIVETGQLNLSYEDRVISFEFAALAYASPEKNRYRFKLEGFDEEWIEVGSDRRFVTYTNLDPGEYVFRVLGSNSDGAWNNVGASINITIPAPWWGTWWFRGGLLLLVIGLIATGFVWQSDRSGRRERELKAQVAERTHEVRERMKELGCLYGISEIASKQGISIEEVLAGTLILLPPAFQFPEIACARIVLDGQEFKTNDYKKTQSSLHAAIVVFEEQAGEVEVNYLEEKPEEDGGLFLEDEKLLLNSVAVQLGGIAERLRAQDELRKHEAHFRAQYGGIPIPTYTWQKRGDDIVLVDYNDAAAAVTQGKVSEFMGLTAGEMYPHRPDIQEDLARCVDEQCSIEREIVYEYMSTGDTRNLALKYGFVAPDMALVHTEDITERVRAQEEAAYERDLMHTLLTHTPDYIYFKDKERKFVRASNSFADLFKLNLEEILGKRDEDLFPPEIAEETVKDDQRVIETGMPLIGKEEGAESIGGDPAWVLTTKLPWYGKDGEIKGLFGISTDITSRKLIEQQLRESEANYRHLVENINEVIYATDAEGLVTYVSPGIESIIGVPPEDVVGELFTKFIAPEDLDRVTDNVEDIMSGKTLGTTEYKLPTDSGEIRWIRVSSQLIKEGDQITGLQGVLTDTTDLKQIEEELEKMAVLAERQRLAREIHDSLTQTLYSINLFSNATQQALSAGKVDEVSKHARQIQELSQDALADMRLLIFELQPPIIEETGLADAVRRRLELVESRAGFNTNIRVVSERPLPTLVESNLYAIAMEALNNTLKHAEAQQISVVINFGEKLVSIAITDDGKGFEPDSSDETRGFGLRSIEERVESINGILSIESSLGEGTTVRVEVPL
jgi:PAS domain S-box-containing protein